MNNNYGAMKEYAYGKMPANKHEFSSREKTILNQMMITLCDVGRDEKLIHQDRSSEVFNNTIIHKFMNKFSFEGVADLVKLDYEVGEDRPFTEAARLDPEADIENPKPAAIGSEEDFMAERIIAKTQEINDVHDRKVATLDAKRERVLDYLRQQQQPAQAGRRGARGANNVVLPFEEQRKHDEAMDDLVEKRDQDLAGLNNAASDWQMRTRSEYKAAVANRLKEISTFEGKIKAAMSVIRESCSTRILERISAEIKGQKPRRAVAKIIDFFKPDDAVRFTERRSANYVWESYVYVTKTSMDNNLEYFEKIAERFNKAHGDRLTELEKSHRFLQGVQGSYCHDELKDIARLLMDKVKLSDNPGWQRIKHEMRAKYQALLDMKAFDIPPQLENYRKPSKDRRPYPEKSRNYRAHNVSEDTTSKSNSEPTANNTSHDYRKRNYNRGYSGDTRRPRYACLWCDGSHWTGQCPTFKCKHNSTKCTASRVCDACREVRRELLEKQKSSSGKSNSVMDNATGREILFRKKSN